MPMLEVPDAFTMLVPDGWSATRNGGTYELTREGDDGAVHVSLYDRDGSRLAEDEAEWILSRFVANSGTSESPEIRVLRENSSQHRAVARFRSEWEGAVFGWLVFVVLWRDRFVLCPCNAASDSSVLLQAEEMFASIFKPKRGIFGRNRYARPDSPRSDRGEAGARYSSQVTGSRRGSGRGCSPCE